MQCGIPDISDSLRPTSSNTQQPSCRTRRNCRHVRQNGFYNDADDLCTISHITLRPMEYRKGVDDIRKILVKRFPYAMLNSICSTLNSCNCKYVHFAKYSYVFFFKELSNLFFFTCPIEYIPFFIKSFVTVYLIQECKIWGWKTS